MEKLVLTTARCKSCGYCVVACPKNALELAGKINDQGYTTIIVDRDKCIVCGRCYIACPDYVYEIKEV